MTACRNDKEVYSRLRVERAAAQHSRHVTRHTNARSITFNSERLFPQAREFDALNVCNG